MSLVVRVGVSRAGINPSPTGEMKDAWFDWLTTNGGQRAYRVRPYAAKERGREGIKPSPTQGRDYFLQLQPAMPSIIANMADPSFVHEKEPMRAFYGPLSFRCGSVFPAINSSRLGMSFRISGRT